MLETLIQSQGGEIHLLPAVPVELSTGSFKGLRARGGLCIDAAWSNGILTNARVISTFRTQTTITMRLADLKETVSFSLEGGATKVVTASDFS